MITLHTNGPRWGLPDTNPLVIKAELLLRMANVAYRKETHEILTALNDRIPYIDDNGNQVGNANFIRMHLENKYMIDFDKGLNHEERATAWAFEKLSEDHIGWLILATQWLDSENLESSTQELLSQMSRWRKFFARRKTIRQMKNAIRAQGAGNFNKSEIARLAERDFNALAAFIGNKTYLMGDKPCGADATVFAFLLAALCPRFKSPVRAFAESHPNLRSYCGRMMRRYYPELLTENFLETKSTTVPATIESAEAVRIPTFAPDIAPSEVNAN